MSWISSSRSYSMLRDVSTLKSILQHPTSAIEKRFLSIMDRSSYPLNRTFRSQGPNWDPATRGVPGAHLAE